MLISSKQTLEYVNNVEVESCKNNLLDFINNSKIYCRNRKINGTILFDTINNSIKFNVGSGVKVKSIDMINLPKGFKLNDVIVSKGKNSIQIDKYGFTSDACTISFNDKFDKRYNLSICVGTSYCEIK